MRPLTKSEGLQPAWIDGTPTAQVAESFIKPNDRLTAFERLEIYNQQYWWRLLGCFSDDFPGLRAVIGERKFDRLAIAYLEAHGSTSWSLRDLGQHVPQFLVDHPELTAPRTALAIEVARVEWAKILAFDSESLPVIDAQRIAHRDPSKVRLKLQPYLSLLDLAFPVDTLLKKLRDDHVETGSASNAMASRQKGTTRLPRANARPERTFLAVHRVDYLVYYKRLTEESFTLLSALRSGASLADACERAFAESAIPGEDAAGLIGEWFNVWMRLGWLCPAK